MNDRPKVGIGIAVFRCNPMTGTRQILLGKRKGSHGEGEWAGPGGHLEHMESFQDCALRELAEEVGSDFVVVDFMVVSVINLTEYAPKHYIDIGIECWWESGKPVIMEPDKCEAWEWFDINDLPENRFATIDRIIDASLDSVGFAQVFDSA